MPTYQYRCVECGNELEAVQKFTDPALTTCPECEGSLRKVYSAVGVVFKGSGFYATDNRTKGKAAAATPAASGEKSSESSGTSSAGSSSASDSSTPSASAGSSKPDSSPAA